MIQPTQSKSSRTYLDYPSVNHAMDGAPVAVDTLLAAPLLHSRSVALHLFPAGLCKDFERKLRSLNPGMATITYDVADLYAYVDQMTDISALV